MVEGLLNNKENKKYLQLKAKERKKILENVAYAVYVDDRPLEVKPLTENEQKAMLNKIEEVVNKYKGKVNITPQTVFFNEGDIFHNDYFLNNGFSKWKKTFPMDALAEFAYFIEPKFSKPKPYKARLSLAFTPKFGGEIFEKLAQFIVKGKNKKLVNELKMMGPQVQGTRTDSGVIYLNTDNEAEILKVTKELLNYIDESFFYDHVPLGMQPVSKGISAAIYNPKGSTSHGEAMANVAAEIVSEYWKAQHSLKTYLKNRGKNKQETRLSDLDKLIQKTLREKGFDPKDPSRLLNKILK